ncbi:transposase [Streptomyces viridosporus]|uniref:transposase n=1 Tax=Streptomyces viridosporus TaxID=67581 RepID=UPI00331B515D
MRHPAGSPWLSPPVAAGQPGRRERSLELGFGSGQTCWRRLDRWQQTGVFKQLRRILLAELNAAGEPDWSRACVDGSHVRAKKGGAATGPSPVDRRKTGSKHHLICDGRGTPLHVITTAANVNGITQTSIWWTASCPSLADPADRAGAPSPSWATRRTTRRPYAGTAAPQDPAGHLPKRRPEHQGPGQAPLRSRADLRPAPPVQTPRRPMGTTPRTPRRLRLIGLQPHLLEAPQEERTMNFRRNSRSYGSRLSWRMTRDREPKPAGAVS